MNRKLLLLALLPVILSACSAVRDTLGLEPQNGPDEFDVATAPPLAIPPDFNLRPPQPGAPRPQAVNPQTTAKELLTGNGQTDTIITGTAPTPADPTSQAENTLLDNVARGKPTDNTPANANSTATAPVSDENGRLKDILESPVTRSESGKLPTIEMQDKGGMFWDSWF